MFNPGLYFQPLDLTKTKVLLKLYLKSFVIWPVTTNITWESCDALELNDLEDVDEDDVEDLRVLEIEGLCEEL